MPGCPETPIVFLFDYRKKCMEVPTVAKEDLGLPQDDQGVGKPPPQSIVGFCQREGKSIVTDAKVSRDCLVGREKRRRKDCIDRAGSLRVKIQWREMAYVRGWIAERNEEDEDPQEQCGTDDCGGDQDPDRA